MSFENKVKLAADALDAHAVEMVKWHFSPETGCKFCDEFSEGMGDRTKDFEGLGCRLGPLEDEADDSAKIHTMRLFLLFSEGTQVIGKTGDGAR